MTKTIAWISLLLPFTAIIFWTVTPSMFTTPKDFLVATLTIIAFIALIFYIFQKQNLPLPPTGPSIPLLLFFLAIIASLVLNPEGRPEAISSYSSLILLPLLALILMALKTKDTLSLFIKSLVFTTTLLATHSILSLTLLSKSIAIPLYMQRITFTPTGAYPITLALILVGTGATIHLLLSTLHKKLNLLYLILAIHIIATITIISLMLPGGSLALNYLPLTASWSIALDALKSLRSLFFGIGLSNYDMLYSSVKPLSLNATPLWNITPSTGTNTILTLLPTAGVLATASFILIMLRLLIVSYAQRSLLLTLPLLILITLIPATTPLYVILVIFYALMHTSSSHSVPLNKKTSLILAGLLILPIIGISTINGRHLLSERYLKIAQDKTASSDSQAVYEYHVKAVKVSPRISDYQLAFADLNYKLALALSQKSELSTSDRETIAQLIKQSIDSSKTAVALRPNDSQAWLTTGKIYQNLIGVADRADNFALEAYARAINLDRANPVLRLEYGNLLSQIASTKKQQSEIDSFNKRAESEFQIAIQLKGDYSNAYYNLAHFYKKQNSLQNAQKAFETALKYYPEGSPEYSQIQLDLNSLATTPTATNSSSTSNNSSLSKPSPLPTPISDIPVDIDSQE